MRWRKRSYATSPRTLDLSVAPRVNEQRLALRSIQARERPWKSRVAWLRCRHSDCRVDEAAAVPLDYQIRQVFVRENDGLQPGRIPRRQRNHWQTRGEKR